MTMQESLTEALEARHALITGQMLVSITMPGGRTMTYSRSSLSALDAYIADLRQQIAGARPRRNRIVYVVPQ